MHNYCFFGTFPIRLARRDKISPCRPSFCATDRFDSLWREQRGGNSVVPAHGDGADAGAADAGRLSARGKSGLN